MGEELGKSGSETMSPPRLQREHYSPASTAPSRRMSLTSTPLETRETSPSARFIHGESADENRSNPASRSPVQSPSQHKSLRFAGINDIPFPDTKHHHDKQNATASGSGLGLLSPGRRSSGSISLGGFEHDTSRPMDIDQASIGTIEDSSDEEERGVAVLTRPPDQEMGSASDSSDEEFEEGHTYDQDGQENIDDITLNVDGMDASGIQEDQEDQDHVNGEEEEDEDEGDNEDEDDEDDDDDEEDDNGSVDLNSEGGDSPVFISSTFALPQDGTLREGITVKLETDSQQMVAESNGGQSHDSSQHGSGPMTNVDSSQPLNGTGTTQAAILDTDQDPASIPNLANDAQPMPSQTADGQLINTLQPKKKKKARKASPTPEPIVPVALIDMQTIRLNFPLNGPELAKDQARMFNFKEEAVTQGVVEKDYWQLLLGVRPMAEDDKSDADKMQEEEGSGDVEQKSSTGKAKMTVDSPVSATAPIGGLAALMAAAGDGPEDMAAMEKLAAQYDKSYEATNPTKKKKKNDNIYDVQDPFVDDSELIYDEPDFYHQPKRSGFYVADGDVELCGEVEDEPVKKKVKRIKATTITKLADATSSTTEGLTVVKKKKGKTVLGMGIKPALHGISSDAGLIKTTGIALTSGDLGDTRMTASGSLTREGSPEVQIITKQVAPIVEPPKHEIKNYANEEAALADVPESLHSLLRDMRQASNEFDWAHKRTFPEVLKGPVLRLARAAIDLRILDDVMFDVIPSFINYNRFTMKKWILKNSREEMQASIEAKTTELLQGLKEEIDTLAPTYISERQAQYEADLLKYENEPKTVIDPVTAETKEILKPNEPPKKWKWTPKMKDLFAAAVENVDYEREFLTISSEIQTDGKWTIPSVRTLNTKLYARMIELFPAEWMTSGILSRELSQIKTKKKQSQLAAAIVST